jgi:cytidylate kinase
MKQTPRSVEAMVEAQVRKWEAERLAAKQKPRHKPVITLSRTFGSRGAALGKLVADKLGFDFWDQELVHAIADHAHMPKKMFESLDEHRKDAVRTVIDTMTFSSSVTEGDYLHQLQRVVHTISEHGAAVIVGRGAHFVLPSSDALRLRIDAPLEHRVKSVVERHGVDEDAARRMIANEDEERRKFVRFHYDRDIAASTDYDLVLNSGTLGEAQMVDIVLVAYRARFPERAGR